MTSDTMNFSDVSSDEFSSPQKSARTESLGSQPEIIKKQSVTPKSKVASRQMTQGLPKALEFTISFNNEVECVRKFKDFLTLRTAFSRAFPGCFVPKI